jgi:predicted cupin superfamily sugar epimerase
MARHFVEWQNDSLEVPELDVELHLLRSTLEIHAASRETLLLDLRSPDGQAFRVSLGFDGEASQKQYVSRVRGTCASQREKC